MNPFKFEDMMCGLPSDQYSLSDTAPICVGTMKEMCVLIERLTEERNKALEALKYLVQEVRATDAASAGVFQIAQIHGMEYRGPTHAESITNAIRVLQEIK